MRNYYQTNFAIVHIHKWGSFSELDDMMPFERDVYKAMLIKYLKDEQESHKEELERQKNSQSKMLSQVKSKMRRR